MQFLEEKFPRGICPKRKRIGGLSGCNYPENLPGDVCREIVEAVNFPWEFVQGKCCGELSGGFPRGI